MIEMRDILREDVSQIDGSVALSCVFSTEALLERCYLAALPNRAKLVRGWIAGLRTGLRQRPACAVPRIRRAGWSSTRPDAENPGHFEYGEVSPQTRRCGRYERAVASIRINPCEPMKVQSPEYG